MVSRLAPQRRLRLVAKLTVLAMALVMIVALLEKGPPPAYVYPEASPANPGPLGTLYLLKLLRSSYRVSPIFTLDNLNIPKNDVCVYAVISPLLPYMKKEAETIVNTLRSSCNRFSLLIADEYTTSNSILEAANSSIRILGEIVGGARVSGNRGLYPEAILKIGDRSYIVMLDIASRVVGGVVAGYTVDSGIAVAAYEDIGNGGIIYAIGDGSIFLNQVVNSNKSAYRDFVIDLFDYLCLGNNGCYIVLDGSHHGGRDVLSLGIAELFRSATSPLDLLHVLLMYIARILHPSFWFPPLVNVVNVFSHQLVTIAVTYPIVLLFIILIIYTLLSRKIPRIQDVRLLEQMEQEYFVTADIRNAIIGGKIKLGKDDFIKLYNMVDAVLKSIMGIGLGDQKAVDILKGVLGDREAIKFVKDMNKLYLKALGKKRLPIVFSWGRIVEKRLRVCENMLKALGVSLEAEKGVEYVLMRGVVNV